LGTRTESRAILSPTAALEILQHVTLIPWDAAFPSETNEINNSDPCRISVIADQDDETCRTMMYCALDASAPKIRYVLGCRWPTLRLQCLHLFWGYQCGAKICKTVPRGQCQGHYGKKRGLVSYVRLCCGEQGTNRAAIKIKLD
jgi:hypothetical protein